jgi:hypothetical protein
MKRSKVIWWIGLRIIGAALVVTLLIAALWMHDVWNDRKHSLQVNSETPIFTGSGDEDCEGNRLTVVQPGAALRVQRIRYWKNCATVDIALPDGQEGHIVLGEGEVSINPPLQ